MPGQASNVEDQEQGYLGQSGFMHIFRPSQSSPILNPSPSQALDLTRLTISPVLRQGFAETYLEYCYPWCPVLEHEDLHSGGPFSKSLLLQQALALLGSIINPPRLRHDSPQTYYERFKSLFHRNHERNALVRIVAITLVYWWCAGPPNLVSMDSQYWWNSVAVRMAQEIGLHREPSSGYTSRPGETASLRRRIWWTLFGRPCIIHPDDCDVRLPTIEDFPHAATSRAELFINWVKICAVVGDVSRYLVQRTESTPFPFDLAQRLIEWVQALPAHLRLPFGTDQASRFDRLLYQLHLPHLGAITLLYVSPSAQSLPKAYTAAILSASCVARIVEDYLVRGSIRFPNGVAGWYNSIAILALLHARRVRSLEPGASEQIDVLYLALKEMAKLWHSSKMFLIGFDKLLKDSHPPINRTMANNAERGSGLDELTVENGVNPRDFFPTTTVEISQIFKVLLTENPPSTFRGAKWTNDLSMQLHDLFDQPYDEFNFDALMTYTRPPEEFH
ncbi:uncharacterized protein Z518_07426 [Rhinocladiella mackenziei CBS 650.93]|uniref:Xylanolytic transcriptional activator regulatory domain-containing protein n=1 Tax=Rhinocladiella mackenziei CBS 650.93 TaxID=1442369 RepID=A0A0D2H0C2_9EURO|nr:uncharacterized protein Z518_07426 [Rhinocladiella mackenziei CBS 650.93]KIX03873.1 hypothetical protein Z518_07426 [Rhinocladiella mackenziei CBS 650.93]